LTEAALREHARIGDDTLLHAAGIYADRFAAKKKEGPHSTT
jgi:hypothetical protein